MKHTITDQGILSKCKAILDKWAASQAYSPTKALGSDAELVSAESYTLERFSMRTSFRVRWKEWRKMPKGSDYSTSPTNPSEYDVWRDVQAGEKTSDFACGLSDTSKREDCPNSECHDGQVTCSSCDGKGRGPCRTCNSSRGYSGHRELAELKSGGYIQCNRCHRTGFLNDGHGGKKPCPDCNPNGYHDFAFSRGHHPGWQVCDDCHGTGIAECHNCHGKGHIDCPECEGQGFIVRQIFVVQKCTADAHSRLWKPESGLTDSFYATESLPWQDIFSVNTDEGRVSSGFVRDASEHALAVMREDRTNEIWKIFDEKTDDAIQAFRSANNNADHKIIDQKVLLEQYDGIVKYDYRFDGKEYTAWINLATESVEECENGLYASIAQDTVRFAQEAEKNGNPQDAIYYYCKADAISLKWGKENGTQKKRLKQYRMLGLWFGGAMLASSLVCWLPGLIVSGMNFVGVMLSIVGLIAISACMISLNEAIQIGGLALVFGLAYAAKNWFGTDFGDDMVTREGFLLSLLFYAFAVVTFTTDHAQRLPKGKNGLLIGGALAGVASLPMALYLAVGSHAFVNVGGFFIPLLALIVLSAIRLPFRLKAGKMQKFVEKNQGKGEVIRLEIEKRKPCPASLRQYAIVVGATALVSVVGIFIGGLFDLCAGNVHFSIIQSLQSIGVL